MRLEYVGGGSRKHWRGERQGASVVYRWGRIGRPEHTLVKRFASVEVAADELEKRQRSKLRKGYVWRRQTWVQLLLPTMAAHDLQSAP